MTCSYGKQNSQEKQLFCMHSGLNSQYHNITGNWSKDNLSFSLFVMILSLQFLKHLVRFKRCIHFILGCHLEISVLQEKSINFRFLYKTKIKAALHSLTNLHAAQYNFRQHRRPPLAVKQASILTRGAASLAEVILRSIYKTGQNPPPRGGD